MQTMTGGVRRVNTLTKTALIIVDKTTARQSTMKP